MTTERINHRAHDHGNTKADRAACRRRMRRYHAELIASIIRVGDAVMVKLDDAPRDFRAVVTEIVIVPNPDYLVRLGRPTTYNRYYVRTENGTVCSVLEPRIWKA